MFLEPSLIEKGDYTVQEMWPYDVHITQSVVCQK